MNTSKNLPAKIHPQWISVFENLVTEQQEKINAIREMEPYYIIVREVMNESKIDNKHAIQVYDTCVVIRIDMLSSDRLFKFNNIVNEITEKLAKMKLRENSPPSFNDPVGSELFYFSYYWRCVNRNNKVKSISLSITIPYDGTVEYGIKLQERTMTVRERIIIKK